MQDFILSGAFNPQRDFFTEFAGIRSVELNLSRNMMETEDFSTNEKFFIPESGKKILTLSGNGVTNNEPEFFRKILTDFFHTGKFFPMKIENTQILIEGNFWISDLNFSENYSSDCQFSMSIQNSGEYKITNK